MAEKVFLEKVGDRLDGHLAHFAVATEVEAEIGRPAVMRTASTSVPPMLRRIDTSMDFMAANPQVCV
jgi:hypothetical protein